MRGLKSIGAHEVSRLLFVPLSPSFYQPECLNQFSRLGLRNSTDIISLMSGLNHFDTWLQIPEYEQQCLAHLAASDKKSEHIKFAKHKLLTGDTASAILTLEKCKRDNWPEVYR